MKFIRFNYLSIILLEPMMADKTASVANKQIMIQVIEETENTLTSLAEMHDLQKNYVEKVIEDLKTLLVYIKENIPIDPKKLKCPYHKLGCPYYNIKEAYLAGEAQLMIKNKDGKIFLQPLSNLELEKIIAIIEESLPTISRLIAAKKQSLEEKVDLLEHIILMMQPAGNLRTTQEAPTET